jgi:hypothetical protein
VADAPAPLQIEGFSPTNIGPQTPSITAQISTEGENYLLVKAEASYDMQDWRDISSTRQLLTIGGKANIRFTDTQPFGDKQPIYFRFVSQPGESKFD